MAKPPKKYSNLSKVEISYIKKKLNITKIQDIDIVLLKQLKEKIKQLKDSRNKNMIIYKLWDIIICVILASLADNNDWEEIHNFVIDNYEWLRTFLQMTGGIPNKVTYERVMGIVDAEELNHILVDFFKTITFQLNPEVELLNFDGRLNNGSKRKLTLSNDSKTPLNCLNVYSNKYGYCIETKNINEKTNEIPTIEKLIKGMNLNGIIATWDALNSQIKNVAAVIASGGDYIIPIKGNQGSFHQDLIDYFDKDKCDEIIAGNPNSSYLTYTEKNHSSVIKYECFLTSDIKWYDKLKDWIGVQSFGMIRKTIIKKGMVQNTRVNAKDKNTKIEKEITIIENRYYISSRPVNVVEFNIATREHWSIENKVHFHLDFTFCQDKNTTTNKNALLNLEIIHKFVLAILQRVKPRYNNKSLKSIRKHLSNNFESFFPELVCFLLLN